VGWLTILQPGHGLSVLDQIYFFWPGQLQREFTPRAIARRGLHVRRSVGCQARLGLVAVGWSVARSVLAVGVGTHCNLVGRGHGSPGLPASCR